ncbi:formate dehydrogenase accessory sulfurtransferase FdhD [uncultured Methylophaga sp.]|uniref:formate dehydrogenase accessory sulfurtransferase FdhD n=1 Tax=uncultured Methylophaga sp. TaxID=285271 RepID=UPI00263239DF|nr:formate dehydrogenase accessory sulfurtransferase FdhD [uncultured Methylophaga sp.]
MQNKDDTAINLAVTVHEDDTASRWKHDDIAVEVPVSLVYNYISHAVMMATPNDLQDFALGFSLTEDIIADVSEVSHIHVHSGKNGITVRMQISDERFEALRERRRSMVGRTGCGLCGVESLKQAIRPVEPVQPVSVSDDAIQTALANIKQHQPLQQTTGATHAAAWCDLDGNILHVREDVGRHNALDKLIGAFKKTELSMRDGFVLVTSRASYEMVQKSASAGFGCLVAVSAPTSLAIEQAREAGLKLVGFARDGRHTIYHDPDIGNGHDSARHAV